MTGPRTGAGNRLRFHQPTEAEFQEAVTDLAHLSGWQTMHVRRSMTAPSRARWATTTSLAGWPDLVLWRPGRLLFRELKSDTGRVSAEQQAVLESLAQSGADVGVWRPSDWDDICTQLRSAR